MLSMRSNMDRMLENFFSNPAGFEQGANLGLPLDVVENQDAYIIRAEVPGLKPEDLDITLNNNLLTIRGETKSEQEHEGERFHLRERQFGSFARSISLPSTVDANAIDANYNAGILTLRLPKAENAKPKRISINTGSQMIEGKASSEQK